MTHVLNLRSAAVALRGDVVSRNRVLCPGPGHSRKDRSLKVTFRTDGTFTVTSYANDDWRACKDYVRERLGLPNDWREPANDNTPTIRISPHQDDQALEGKIRNALKRWETSVPIADTLAEKYLHSRGLSYAGDTIRFRPNDRSMIALLTDVVTAEPCGVHQTYLDRDGLKLGRKMRGRAKSAVVRLSPDDSVHHGLAIGEGIETCLATGFTPIWACLSANGIASFPVLSGVECLTIYADNDHTGMSAANDCGSRWHAASKEVEIIAPSEIGADFADEMEAA